MAGCRVVKLTPPGSTSAIMFETGMGPTTDIRPVKAALTVVSGALGTVLLSEALHWRASKRFLGRGHAPGRSALIVLGFPARRDGNSTPSRNGALT